MSNRWLVILHAPKTICPFGMTIVPIRKLSLSFIFIVAPCTALWLSTSTAGVARKRLSGESERSKRCLSLMRSGCWISKMFCIMELSCAISGSSPLFDCIVFIKASKRSTSFFIDPDGVLATALVFCAKGSGRLISLVNASNFSLIFFVCSSPLEAGVFPSTPKPS
ncbi:hypothetical protein D9M68_653900 [compost metagenome]